VSVCAVIPAAGRGTRLGGTDPKILSSLTDGETIWSVLHARLTPLVDHVHLVLSPAGAAAFPALPANVSASVQPVATGMGDAIFQGSDVWSKYAAILVVWGDQVFVSADTLRRSLAALKPGRNVVLPVSRMPEPYVEYVFEESGALTRVLQTREGDNTAINGFSDVGTFLLRTEGLKAAWEEYLVTALRGGATGEINFLPFLPFLSAQGWSVTPLEVLNAIEARGINTPDDLAFFRSLYKNAP
jgi:bifunctional UDP-N-acetylglucosamine pyrophosphorylase/glucosamine-1-phosphate N-acetyltransferase